MIKMIFCDMDGTLLDGEGNLPPDFDEIAEELINRGAVFVPASGRQYSALLFQLGKYIEKFIFVAENGTFVSKNDIELFSDTMEKSDVLRILKVGFETEGAYPVLCGKKMAYVNEAWRPYLLNMEQYFTRNTIVNDMEKTALEKDIIKVAFCDAERGDAEHTIFPAIKRAEGNLQVVLSSNYWIDVMNRGVSKGTAVRKLQKKFGILPEECAAFGDYLNDLDMLSSVKYSFAMENAHPKVKSVASESILSNLEYGVTAKIRELLNLKFI